MKSVKLLLVILAAIAALGLAGCFPRWQDGWGKDYWDPPPREVDRPEPPPGPGAFTWWKG